MNTISTLIGVVLLLAFTLPILFLVYQQRNKTKKHKQRLDEILNKHHFSSNHITEIGYLVFALDKQLKEALIFTKDGIDETIIHYKENSNQKIALVKNTKKLNSGKQVIRDIMISFQDKEIIKELYVFDEAYPNHLQAEDFLTQSYDIVHRIQFI